MSGASYQETTGYFLRSGVDSLRRKKGQKTIDSISGKSTELDIAGKNQVTGVPGKLNTAETGAMATELEPETVSTTELKELILRLENKGTTRLDRMENELLEMKGNQKKNEEKLEGLEHISKIPKTG